MALAAMCQRNAPINRSCNRDTAIFHLMDFHEPLRASAEIRRRLRDIYESIRGRRKFVVITSPVRAVPEELERSLLFLELRPPDLIELTAFLREESGEANDSLIHQLAPVLLGLTLDEAQAWVVDGAGRAFDPKIVDAFVRSMTAVAV